MSVRRSLPRRSARRLDGQALVEREWLVTNGLGGYASGTIAGVATRRYHGLLVAALQAPRGRVMALHHLSERLRLSSWESVPFGGQELAGGLEVHGAEHLAQFRLEGGLPVWRYDVGGVTLEKRVFLPHLQNTVLVQYRLLRGSGVLRLELRPSVHFRGHDEPVGAPHATPYRLSAVEGRYELSAEGPFPPLRMLLCGARAAFTLEARTQPELVYRVEASRGYDAHGSTWSPGHFRVDLSKESPATLIASVEAWETILAVGPVEAGEAECERRRRLLLQAPECVHRPSASAWAPAAELVLAADAFLVRPTGRLGDEVRARSRGEDVRTVIAGYHWFTDWGRDTMIALEGLTLATGRQAEAGMILRTFAGHVRDGLIPNLFPEGETEGLYHTADATLWFFHALARYVARTGDRHTLLQLLPALREIVERHVAGTRFGIGVDPEDGLLRQGAPGYQLTWMDAKVGDWVVTPRRGKAVEINALWYNALRLLEGWMRETEGEAAAEPIGRRAEQARRSFHERFWYEPGGYLYDVVDGEGGDDPACRPNQVFALALDHAVLERELWEPVLDVVHRRLWTPVGLRSLAPGHPDYQPRYSGDLRSRDAAYHQGTVWAWLVGPFVDAWLRVRPEDRAGARALLAGFEGHLGEACLGQIGEIFDAEEPYAARGCVAQAWSVAELLRAWLATEP